MTFRFALAVFGLIAVVNQSNAALCFPPPPCGCGAQPAPSLSQLLAAFSAPPAPAVLSPAALLSPPVPVPALALPATIPCPEPAPSLKQKPDVNIPLPLPAKIPLGNFCTCQKFAIKPALIPCAPAPPAPLPFPAPPAFVLPPASAPALNLQALLNSLGAVAPPPQPTCFCA